MGEKHEEFRKQKKELAEINTDRGGGPDGVKGFFAEAINTTNSNLGRIEKGIKAREIRLDDNGIWDGKIVYSSGANGREIQDKVGYTIAYYREIIESGKYDSGILRINPDNPIFDNAEKLHDINELASRHDIKIVKGSVPEKEVKTLAKVAYIEGKLRSAIGLEKKAPVTAELYTDYKEMSYIVKKCAPNNVINEEAYKSISHGLNEGYSMAKESAIFEAKTTSIINIMQVANGEKEIDEALKDVAKDTGKTFAKSYVSKGGLEVAKQFLKQSKGIRKKLGESKVTASQITQALDVGGIVYDFLNGDTTESECIVKLGSYAYKGVVNNFMMIIGDAICPVIGGAIGALVGNALMDYCVDKIMYSLQNEKMHNKEMQRMYRLCDEAATMLYDYSREYMDYIDNYYSELDNAKEQAFRNISASVLNGDFEGFNQSLDDVLIIFGISVEHMSEEQWHDCFLDDDFILEI